MAGVVMPLNAFQGGGQREPKIDPLTRVLQGLQIANEVFKLPVAYETFRKYRNENAQTERLEKGIFTPAEALKAGVKLKAMAPSPAAQSEVPIANPSAQSALSLPPKREPSLMAPDDMAILPNQTSAIPQDELISRDLAVGPMFRRFNKPRPQEAYPYAPGKEFGLKITQGDGEPVEMMGSLIDDEKRRSDLAGKLHDDWKQHPQTTRSIIASDAMAGLEEAAKLATPPADHALAVQFIKLFDPTSAVLRGEAESVTGLGSVPQRIIGWLNNILNGGKFLDWQRAQLMEVAREKYQSTLSAQDVIDRNYAERAMRWNVEPKDVVDELYVPKRGQGVAVQEKPIGPKPKMNAIKRRAESSDGLNRSLLNPKEQARLKELEALEAKEAKEKAGKK